MGLNVKIRTVVLMVIPVIGIVTYLIYRYKEPFTVITPENGITNDFSLKTFTDKLHNGNSEITISRQRVPFEYQYCLKEGYRYKFALVSIIPNDSNSVDLSEYNQINFRMKSRKGKGILFYLYTAFPNDKKINHPSWPHQYILNADTTFTDIRLSLDQFYTPDWWYTEVYETKTSLGPPRLNKTLAMSFGQCVHIKTDTPDVVTVSNMTFSVNLFPHFTKALSVAFGYYLLLLSYIIIRRQKRKRVIFTETGVPVGSTESEEQRVFQYMGIHYFEPTYSIQQLSRQSGLSVDKINEILKVKTGLTFKQILNDLRIAEAERLLEHTDLPVNELAEKVGFKSREHFSRLFKSKTGFNPLEVRKKKEGKL